MVVNVCNFWPVTSSLLSVCLCHCKLKNYYRPVKSHPPPPQHKEVVNLSSVSDDDFILSPQNKKGKTYLSLTYPFPKETHLPKLQHKKR
jgi:hypothetical protein